MARVTVVVPAYNAARFLPEALDSVTAQSYHDYELILVDDASTDETAAVAASRRAVVIRRGARGGPAAARNDGIRSGSGELIALIDADDAWHPEKLRKQVALLDARPRAILAATRAERFGSLARFDPPLEEGEVTEGLLRENFLVTSSILMRRSAWERAGPFDTDPGLVSVEDYDLWLRLSLLGEFAALDEVLVRRRLHAGNLSADHLELYLRTLRVIEKFELADREGLHAATIGRRKAELSYLIGRAHLGRGQRQSAREALRRSRALSSGFARRTLPFECLSFLPASWLSGIGKIRSRLRAGAAAAGGGPPAAA